MEINDLVGKHALGFKFNDLRYTTFVPSMHKFIGQVGKIIEVSGGHIPLVRIKFPSEHSCWYPINHPDFKIVDEDAPVQGEKLLFSIV